MTPEFYITLITVVGSIVGIAVKSHFEGRKNRRELSARDKLLTNELRGLQNKVMKIGESIDNLKLDTDFRNGLKNSIRIEASRIVNLSYDLEPYFKNILMFWAVQIEDLSLKYYYSPYRNNHDELEKYLTVDIESRKSIVENYANNLVEYSKVYNGKKILFTSFLEKTDAYKKLDLFIMRLVQNGMSEDQVTEEFVKFIHRFFEHIIKAIVIWRTLVNE
jgi:hypothetical protein